MRRSIATAARAAALASALLAPQLGPTAVRADVIVPARAQPRPTPYCLELMVESGRSPSAQRVEMSGRVAVRGGRERVQRSLVEVRDRRGALVFRSQEGAFFGAPRPRGGFDVGLGFSSSAGPALPALPPGEYVAEWRVDGATSNQARFAVGPGSPPPLELVLLDRGCAPGPALMVHLHNDRAQPIDLPDALGDSVLIVDGVHHPRGGVEWDGASMLPRGESWGTIVSFGEYGAPLVAGRHEVVLEMAGRRSNALVVTVGAEATR
jgi:hypothetical protein